VTVRLFTLFSLIGGHRDRPTPGEPSVTAQTRHQDARWKPRLSSLHSIADAIHTDQYGDFSAGGPSARVAADGT
jgi:hypothetical protein